MFLLALLVPPTLRSSQSLTISTWLTLPPSSSFPPLFSTFLMQLSALPRAKFRYRPRAAATVMLPLALVARMAA